MMCSKWSGAGVYNAYRGLGKCGEGRTLEIYINCIFCLYMVQLNLHMEVFYYV